MEVAKYLYMTEGVLQGRQQFKSKSNFGMRKKKRNSTNSQRWKNIKRKDCEKRNCRKVK